MGRILIMALMTVTIAALTAVIWRQQGTIETLREEARSLSGSVDYLRRTDRKSVV